MNRKPVQLICGVTADADILADDVHQPMRTLFAYWDERRDGDRAMPKANLDPVDIARLLPNVFLADLVSCDPFDIAYRLAGTRVVDFEGEITGRRLSELIPRAPGNETVWEQYENAIGGEPCFRRATLDWRGRGFITYDVLLLPMTRTGGGADGALGMSLYGIEGHKAL